MRELPEQAAEDPADTAALFGGVARLRAALVEELVAVTGLEADEDLAPFLGLPDEDALRETVIDVELRGEGDAQGKVKRAAPATSIRRPRGDLSV